MALKIKQQTDSSTERRAFFYLFVEISFSNRPHPWAKCQFDKCLFNIRYDL